MKTEHFIGLKQQLAEAETLVRDTEYELAKYKRRKQLIEELMEVGRAGICDGCDGYGKIRVHTLQDESHLETCKQCSGSGRTEKHT